MRNRDILNRLKIIVDLLTLFFKLFGKKGNYLLFRLFRNIPTKIGILLRYITLKNCAISCGWNVCIKTGCIIKKPDHMSFGDNVSVNEYCYIDAEGKIDIGKDVSIAHNVSLISFEHQYNDLQKPIKDQNLSLSKIIIKDNVWIGAKCSILSGITIEKGSIVGANSVVTKNIPENSIYGGCPAKLIKNRI